MTVRGLECIHWRKRNWAETGKRPTCRRTSQEIQPVELKEEPLTQGRTRFSFSPPIMEQSPAIGGGGRWETGGGVPSRHASLHPTVTNAPNKGTSGSLFTADWQFVTGVIEMVSAGMRESRNKGEGGEDV